MTSYAIGHLRNVNMGPDIIAYLETIDATLAPFQGRFIIHGSDKEELEGRFPDDVVVIAFPDLRAARAWYGSPAYQAILPKRTGNSQGDVFLIDGVDEGHRATDILLPRQEPRMTLPGPATAADQQAAYLLPLPDPSNSGCRKCGPA